MPEAEARIVPLLTESVFLASPVLILNVIHFPLPWIASFARTLGLFLTVPLSSCESSLRVGALPQLSATLVPGLLSASGLQLVAWQARVLQCHGPSSTGEVPNQSPVLKGLCCPELLCMCWKCPEQMGLHPLQRQSHNRCLKSPFFWPSGCLS